MRVKSAQPVFRDIPGILSDLDAILRSGKLMLGPYLEQFESEFAALAGRDQAIGVSSCTAALEIVLRFIGIEGCEVLVPTSTFVATANAVLYAGGTPVLLDVAKDTLCLEAKAVEEAINERTKAVMVVHLGGLMWPSLPELEAVCANRGLVLVEDCAHAHGAELDGRAAGAYGLAGCFSFYPTKIMTTATGGMIVTNDSGLAEFARSVRVHGRGSGSRGGLDSIVNFGNDWFLDEVRAVLGLHQLRGLSDALTTRRRLAGRYLEQLADNDNIQPVIPSPRCSPAYYKFMVMLENADVVDRLKARLLRDYGIETESLYYPPCHLQPVYQAAFGYRAGDFPIAEGWLSRQLCLPLHAAMDDDAVDYVVASLRTAIATEEGAMRAV